MTTKPTDKKKTVQTAREQFLGLSLESTRKSYYPQLMAQLETARENERRLRLLTDNLPARISYADKDQYYRFVNREYEKNLKRPREQIVGKQISDILGPDNYSLVKPYIEKAIGGQLVHFEAQFKHKGEESTWLDINYVPDIDEKNNVIGFYSLTNDITERKRTEEILRENEEQYRLLVDNANDAIFIAQDGLIKFPNPKALQLLNLDKIPDDSIPFAEYIHPDDRKMVVERHLQRLSGAKNLPPTYSFRVVNSTGKDYTVELNAVKIQWKGKPATLNFLRDVTHQKKLEENLQQAQKMKAIGTLAGGIAHDFNNILMGIQGRVSLLLSEIDSAHPHFEHLTGISSYVKNATDLTNQLLGFARGGKYELKPTDLNQLVNQNLEMFSRTKKEISIIRQFEDKLWSAEVDRGQISQVLLNLFVNASQAMPGGGTLYVSTQNQPLEETMVPSVDLAPGRYVKISITDTGVGMDTATRARIFDPFFTTKTMGRGTGLGLASAYGIIRNHDGAIKVYSEPGKGSSFNIYLPASHRRAIHEHGPQPSQYKTGNELILIVDDEDVIVDVGRQMLEKLGYRVLTAQSGEEALQHVKTRLADIDLIILDMIMPGQSGGEVFDRIKEIDPEMDVLLSSGYSLNGQAQRILQRGCRGFIQKPFSLSALSTKIREILDPKD